MSWSKRRGFKRLLHIAGANAGPMNARSWPRNRTKTKQPDEKENQDRFRVVTQWLKYQDPGFQAYSIDNSPGKLYMPRDIAMAAMYGVLTEIYYADGNVAMGVRNVSVSIQGALDTISDAPGSMIVRTATEWIALSPAALHLVLASAGPGNVPYWLDVTTLFPTVQQLLDGISADEGSTLYRSGSAWTELPAGSDGQIMAYDTLAGGPIWQTQTFAPTWAFDNRFKTTGTTVGLANIPSGNLIANTATAAAEPISTSLSALLDVNVGSATGAMLARGPTGWGSIAAGSLGQVLVSQGSTLAPSWQSAGPAGIGRQYVPAIPGTPNAGISSATGLQATKGNKVSFDSTQTIYAMYWPIPQPAVGQQFIAQISQLSTLNVATAVDTSGTITATDTVAAFERFDFTPPIVVNTGTIYGMTVSRIDSTGSVSLGGYVYQSTAQALMMERAKLMVGSGIVLAGTRVAVGSTLSVATPSPYQFAYELG